MTATKTSRPTNVQPRPKRSASGKTSRPTNNATRPKLAASGETSRPTTNLARSKQSASDKTSRPTKAASRSKAETSDGNGAAPSTALASTIFEATVAAPPSLGEIVYECDTIEPALDDHALAVKVVERLQTIPERWEILAPAIIEFVRNRRRQRVRRAEHRVFKPGDGTERADDPVRELTLAQLADLVDEYVTIPGVGRKLAGDVTVDEWQLRTAELQDQIVRDQYTVAMYGQIIGLLQRRHCQTIREALRKRGRQCPCFAPRTSGSPAGDGQALQGIARVHVRRCRMCCAAIRSHQPMRPDGRDGQATSRVPFRPVPAVRDTRRSVLPEPGENRSGCR